MKFSQRIGKIQVRSILQTEDIDTDLKNRLWNDVLIYFDSIRSKFAYGDYKRDSVFEIIWTDFLVRPSDIIPQSYGSLDYDTYKINIKTWFFEAEWYEIYDLIEYLCTFKHIENIVDMFTISCNSSLSKEVAGYRIVNRKVLQITSDEEISEIKQALTDKTIWAPVTTHLSTALSLLADKQNPDYRNSVKESISAVESMCKIITTDPSITLGKALTEIEKKYPLHKALKSAFSSLYGYTSDAGGIRHALLEDDLEVKFEDAKFMLVSCSAFINYLKAKIK